VTLEPFAANATPAQWQTICFASEIGASSRTITGVDWFKYCTQFATTVSGMRILMGHTQGSALSTNFNSNYSDTPISLMGPATYNISTGSGVWFALPPFSQNFPFNGTDNLILEIQHTGSSGGGYVGTVAQRGYAEWYGNNFWQSPAGKPVRSAHTVVLNATYGTGTPPSRTTIFRYDTRLTFMIEQSEAQSKWYDSNLLQPQYLDAVVIGTVPVGTTSTFTFQGAPELPLSGGLPDEDNATDWVSSLSELAGYRFIRIHWVAKGNGQSNQLPEIDDIIFPFIFFD
jgi:hypothetical protein